MTFDIEVTREEFPSINKELDELNHSKEIDRCSLLLRKIISEKVGLNIEEYQVTLLDYYLDENLTWHYTMEWDYKGKENKMILSNCCGIPPSNQNDKETSRCSFCGKSCIYEICCDKCCEVLEDPEPNQCVCHDCFLESEYLIEDLDEGPGK